jgi:hypothetical protein
LEHLIVDGRITLKEMFKKQAEKTWIGLIWLTVGIRGRIL